MQEALHDFLLYRAFTGLEVKINYLPDESMILRFRHLLQTHHLALRILQTVNTILSTKRLMLKSGTVIDATLISAPSSTKNNQGQRDSKMHSTKKGKQWHFGIKAHMKSMPYRGLCAALSAQQRMPMTSHRPTFCCMEQKRMSLLQDIKALRNAKKPVHSRSNRMSLCALVSDAP